MRTIALFVALAGCGRVGFDERLGDGDPGPGSDGGDAAAVVGFSHLVAYADQTCALYKGVAYCWGDNSSNKLGIGATMQLAEVPTAVALPAGTVSDLSEGANHGCAIVDGTLYCYGSLTGGVVSQLAVPSAPATAVRCGNDFACVLGTGGQLSCWGSANSTGQLAVGDTNPRATPTPTLLSTTTAFSIGDDHGCAIQSGSAVCWGHNDFGTLGTGTGSPGSTPSPVAVTGSVTVLPHIAGWHACMLDASKVSCWGEGDHGEIGDGLATSYPAPHLVPSLVAPTVIAVGGGPADLDASCAIAGGGNVYCWGVGMYGRLGQNVAANSGVPVAVGGLPGPAVELALGYDHTCAVLATGDAWCWGRGDKGQLGDGLVATSLVPVRVKPPF